MRIKNEPVLLRDVLQCFARFPQREDTLSGIVEWWLMENRIEWCVVEVQAALDELVTQGFVLTWSSADGQKRYRANPKRQKNIQKLADGFSRKR